MRRGLQLAPPLLAATASAAVFPRICALPHTPLEAAVVPLTEHSPSWGSVRRGGAKAVRSAGRARRRGGARGGDDDDGGDPYALLARAILSRLSAPDESGGGPAESSAPPPSPTPCPDPSDVASALRRLSAAQSALKSIDGAAHEAYQRTHGGVERSAEGGVSADGVAGRASRSAARAGCAADGLFAAELCELAERGDELVCEEHALGGDGTLAGREVWMNVTLEGEGGGGGMPPLTVLVLHEASYDGGAGLGHGGIDDILRESSSHRRPPRGRLLVVIRDPYSSDLTRTVAELDVLPEAVGLSAGLVTNEVASVNGRLWRAAGRVLEEIRPLLVRARGGDDLAGGANATAEATASRGEEPVSSKNATAAAPRPEAQPAVHFVGRSLGGGVAALCAAILDGSLPMPPGRKERDGKPRGSRSGRGRKRSRGKDPKARNKAGGGEAVERERDGKARVKLDSASSAPAPRSLCGLALGHASAVALGPPPCLSPNVRAAYVTSVIHGDDAVPRTTRRSLDRLCRRIKKMMRGGILGSVGAVAGVGWIGDAASLAADGLRSHAHGSEGEEGRLAAPGRAFLVRPRRLGGASSLHEVGGGGGGGGGGSGREALRAAVLWQLNDVLLSRSLWAHHRLERYIDGLDRVQLRGFAVEGEEEQ